MQQLNSNLVETISPPVMEARKWLSEIHPKTNQSLLNVSQAAPIDLPHPLLREAIAQAVINSPSSSVYGPVLGNPELRSEIAEQWSELYEGLIYSNQVALTSGCNQAFTTVISTLAQSGDTIMLTAPWYFNHKMWLDMMGIQAKILDVDENLLPDPTKASKLLCDNVKAIVLISPNNPCGVEYSKSTIKEFFQLAKANNIYLILDETYRDFSAHDSKPHDLFCDPNWAETFIHLYSFSKAYRLTGYRLGCIITNEELLQQAEKILDTISICPNQLAQVGALHGLQNLRSWLLEERQVILNRGHAIETGLRKVEGWQLLGYGAYFAYVRHPFSFDSEHLVKLLLEEENILMLPDTMFENKLAEPQIRSCGQHVRVAFANINTDQIEDFFHRLKRFTINNNKFFR